MKTSIPAVNCWLWGFKLAFNRGWIWPVQLASHVSPTEGPEVADGIQVQLSPHKNDNQHLLGVFDVIAWGPCASTRLIERVSGKESLRWVISTHTPKNTYWKLLFLCGKSVVHRRWRFFHGAMNKIRNDCSDTNPIHHEIIHKGVMVQLDMQDFTFCVLTWGIMYIIEGNILRK